MELLEESGVRPIRLCIKASSPLEETLSLIHYLDAVSLELADMKGMNPLKVERISKFKRIMET
jgi:hypothetical protein